MEELTKRLEEAAALCRKYGVDPGGLDEARARDFRLRVAVLGLSLFLLLWEARSRYLVNFLPVMLAAAFPAVDEGGQSV